jgi:hypothetical protein
MQVPIGKDGSFEVALPSGNYRLCVSVEDGGDPVNITQTAPVHVAARSTTELHLRLPLQRLPLLVVDNQTGKPIPGATLSIDEERELGSFRVWTADESGTLEIYPCPIGDFGLSIQDRTEVKWTSVQRVALGGATPVTLRVQR